MYPRCHTATKTELLRIKNLSLVGIVFIFSTLFWQCKQETQKIITPTNAEIYLRYLDDQKVLTAETTFYMKGDSSNTILKFDNVTLNNHPMKGKNLDKSHTRYRIDFEKHTLAPAYELRFWNQKETPKSIALNMPRVDSVSLPRIIKKGHEAPLRIYGNSLSPNEKISFIFTNEKNETTELKLENVSIEKPTMLNKKQLSNLPIGKNKAYLIRTKISDDKSENSSAKKVLQFFSQTIDTEIVE